MLNQDKPKYYLVRFKGYKLDKAWKCPRIAKVDSMFPFAAEDVREKFKRVVLLEGTWFTNHSESRDFEQFELVKELPSDVVEKYKNLKYEYEEKRKQEAVKVMDELESKYQDQFMVNFDSLLSQHFQCI